MIYFFPIENYFSSIYLRAEFFLVIERVHVGFESSHFEHDEKYSRETLRFVELVENAAFRSDEHFLRRVELLIVIIVFLTL